MIVLRLLLWVFRVPCLPVVDAVGRNVPGKQRVASFAEAWKGASST